MSRRFRTTLIIALLAGMTLLAGCAAPGPKFSKTISPNDGKAIIYVYRASFALTNGEMPGVQMNDTTIVSALPHTNYFAIAVEPGSYTFTPKLFGIYGTTPADINVEAGQTYFVRMRMEIGHIGFYSVSADDAMAYMPNCYLMNPGFAKDPRVLSAAAAEPTSSPEPTTVAPAPQPASTTTSPAPAVSSVTEEQAAPVVTETQLFVETQPADAKVRIMNIKPQFEQGIVLSSGRYKIDVSAAGYKSHVEWITLTEGEKRVMQVALVSTQPKVVTPEPAPEPTPTPAPVVTQAAVTAPVPAPVVKTPDLKVPGNLSAEEKRVAKLLQSDSAVDLRSGAKSVYYRHLDNKYLTDLAAQVLLEEYNQQMRDRNHVDAMAWLCKALGKTGNSSYRAALETVAETGKSRKIRGYASKNLRYL